MAPESGVREERARQSCSSAACQSAVVASGGSARLVAPLRSGPGAALSAVSALRPDGDRSTAAGASLAARELSTARPGPHQIVVFTTGADNGDPSVARLSDELVRAGVLTCVVQTQPVDFWTRIVDRAGGSIVASQTEDVVTSVEELAATLEDLTSSRRRAVASAVAAVGFGYTARHRRWDDSRSFSGRRVTVRLWHG